MWTKLILWGSKWLPFLSRINMAYLYVVAAGAIFAAGFWGGYRVTSTSYLNGIVKAQQEQIALNEKHNAEQQKKYELALKEREKSRNDAEARIRDLQKLPDHVCANTAIGDSAFRLLSPPNR